MAKTLIHNAIILTLNSKREVINPGALLIDDCTIIDVGTSEILESKYPDAIHDDAQGRVVMPGLINTHVHAAQILLRGGPSQDKNHLDWLANVLYPAINNYDEENVRTAYQLFALEAVRTGTTTIVDNVVWGNRRSLTDVALGQLQEIGLRSIYAWIFSDLESQDQETTLSILRGKDKHIKRTGFPGGKLEETLVSIENLMGTYHGKNGGLISIWPAPGIPLFVSQEGLRGAVDLAKKYNTQYTIHLAETSETSKHLGMSVVDYLEFSNALTSHLVAAHCVWVSDHDIRLLRKQDVKVVNNVVSNMFLGSGIAPVTKMLEMGITVGIGTDDANCNNSVNMFSDMKYVALAQKVKELDASAITAERVLEMATIDGAKVIGMENEIGSLEIGKHADLIIVDMNRPHLKPCFHIPSTLVYQANGSEVDSVMVNGKWLMKEREIMFLEKSENEIMESAQKSSLRVLKKSGMEHLCNRGWLS